jgi:hypothetical protein
MMGCVPRLSTTHYRWLAALWTVAILVGVSLPAASLSPVSAALSFDKAIHFGLFAVFGALWMRGLCPPASRGGWQRFRRRGLQLGGVGVLFAGGSEVYQQLMPIRRMADPYDAVADIAGLLAGILLYAMYMARVRAQRSTAGQES